jgi:hypothetical protein
LADAGERLEVVVLPAGVDASQGNLTVQVAPSLAASMQSSLKSLANERYDCTEQMVSKFLPNVLTYGALKKLGLSNPELEQQLPSLVSEALQKLYVQQYVDGSWSWCYNPTAPRNGDPFVTAYALFGLVKAREAGFSIADPVINQASKYLAGRLANPATLQEPWQLNRQMFILYTLAQAGQGDSSRTTTMYEQRPRLANYAKALLALTLAKLDAQDSRLPTVLADLANTAISSATGTHWEETDPDTWNMNTDTRSTALALEAFATLDGKNALNPNIVRWLMVARTADAWETSQETAWAMIALTDWLQASGELQADYAWKVQLNGTEINTGQASPPNITETAVTQVAIADLLRDSANRLLFQHSTGPGKMYYTAHLETYQAADSVRADSRGVVIGRQYTIVRDTCGHKNQPDCPPATEAPAGDTIQVTLNIVAPHDLVYVVVEDPFPAGAEAVDTSLKTTSMTSETPQLTNSDRNSPFGDGGWGWWYFNRSELRDEKLVLYADRLPAGSYAYTYTLHASLPGTYKVIPPTAREVYFPEVYGRGDGSEFRIR